MALTTITNAQVDAAAALVAAPYGPLVRVSDVTAFPTPNSNRDIEFTSALGITVHLTYEMLVDEQTRTPYLIARHSLRGVNAQMETVRGVVQAVASNIDSFGGPPYSDAEWQSVIDALRTIVAIVAQPPNVSSDYEDGIAVALSFTTGGVDPTTSVVNTSTGQADVLMWSWDWGDGTFSIGANPAPHLYTVNGVYSIVLTGVTRAGVKTFTGAPVTIIAA